MLLVWMRKTTYLLLVVRLSIATCSRRYMMLGSNYVCTYLLSQECQHLGLNALLIAMPNNPCPGVVGATLGGGVGLFQGIYGLALDALVSVQLITGRGEILTASETENSDLFWGIRGAGYNYGIVTSATFRVYDAPNNGSILSADFMFPGSANGSIWETLASFDDSFPDELVLNILASYDSSTAAPIIIVNVVYLGVEAEAQPFLDVFTSLGPTTSSVQEVPWTEIASVAFFGANAPGDCTAHGVYANDYTIGLAQTDVSTFVSFFNDLTTFWQAHPDYSGFLVAERMSTAFLQSIPVESTSYGHRDIKTHILFENIYPADASLDDTVNDFMREARAAFQATSGFAELQAFVNYAHGDEGPEAWYTSAKLPKLTALKNEYDPLQLLSWNNPVPLK